MTASHSTRPCDHSSVLKLGKSCLALAMAGHSNSGQDCRQPMHSSNTWTSSYGCSHWGSVIKLPLV